jgi:hypothetical protein
MIAAHMADPERRSHRGVLASADVRQRLLEVFDVPAARRPPPLETVSE